VSLPADFLFSQSALQYYVDCPRRFEWPALETRQAREQEEQARQGRDFHHLLHQQAMGVPVEALEATIDDETTLRWWRSCLGWQEHHLPATRHAELVLSTPLAGRRLMARYDLVARMEDGGLLIVDWKTGRMPRAALLAGRMQTIVYPYVLASAGGWLSAGRLDNTKTISPEMIRPDEMIRPEMIRMIYWFAEEGRTIEFGYDEERRRQAEERLATIIGEIGARSEFAPTTDERACRFCRYRSFCERGVEAGDLSELNEAEADESITLDLDELEEIAF
jgi:hypothetical protein